MDEWLPLRKTLKDGATVAELYVVRSEEDKKAVHGLLNDIIEEGLTYPQQYALNEKEFMNYFMAGETFIVRTADAKRNLLGAFYIKKNFQGRCSHICNAGFLVEKSVRGIGVGRFMGETMLPLAKLLGYEAVMFNLVFETNVASLNLWNSLGFKQIGRIPRAARLIDGRVTDAIMMYYDLSTVQNPSASSSSSSDATTTTTAAAAAAQHQQQEQDNKK